MILSPNELLFGMLYSGLGQGRGAGGGVVRAAHKITLKQIPVGELRRWEKKAGRAPVTQVLSSETPKPD